MGNVKKYGEFIKEQKEEDSKIGYSYGESGITNSGIKLPRSNKSDIRTGADNIQNGQSSVNTDETPKLTSKDIQKDEILDILQQSLSIDTPIGFVGSVPEIERELGDSSIKTIIVHSENDIKNNFSGGKVFLMEPFIKDKIDSELIDSLVLYTIKK